MPRFSCVNPAMRSIWRASSSTALAPAAKSRPACAARPRTVMVKFAHALARRFELAFGAGGRLQHQHGLAARGVLLGERPRGLAAHFLIGVELQYHAPGNRRLQVAQRFHRENEERDSGLHVEARQAPRAGHPPRGTACSPAFPMARQYRSGPAPAPGRSSSGPGSFISATRCLPKRPPGNVFTAAKGPTVSETSSTKRLTAAGLSLGDSHSTNRLIRATISGAWVCACARKGSILALLQLFVEADRDFAALAGSHQRVGVAGPIEREPMSH